MNALTRYFFPPISLALRQLECAQTHLYDGPAQVDLALFREHLACLSDTQMADLFLRPIEFYDDGSSFYDVGAEPLYQRRSQAIRDIMALYWDAIESSWNRTGLPQPYREALVARMSVHFYQRNFFEALKAKQEEAQVA